MSDELVPQPENLPVVVQPKKKKRIRESKFVDTLTVRTDKGDRFKVPVNANANRAQAQLIGAKLRAVIDKSFDYILKNDVEMEPASLKDLAAATKAVEEINKIAHSAEGVGEVSAGSPTSDIGKIAANMVKGAVEGMAEANNKAFSEKLAAIQAAGNNGKRTLFNLKQADKVIDAE